MKFLKFVFLCVFLFCSDVVLADEIVIFGTDNTTPYFSDTAVNLLLQENSSLSVINDDALLISGGSSVMMAPNSRISVTNSISEGVGIHVWADTLNTSNAITLDSGSSIRIVTEADNSSEYVYSEKQARSYLPLFPSISLISPITTEDSLYASVN